MDKLESYREIIKRIVGKHSQYQPSHGQIQNLPICDANSDNFLLIDVGWDKSGRVHSVVFHLRIFQGKIWIEWDGTEGGIAQELLDSGVEREDIVLGFYRPERRKLTDFSVA